LGLDIHSLNLLRFGAKAGVDYSNILTMGRPGLFLSDDELMAFLGNIDLRRIRADGFSEEFLKTAFGAKEVVSLDASPYEKATIIHDMNLPLTGAREFSAVLDFGCLEHVFNFPVAISNVIASCRAGGHLLHVLPANNWCGHGFYQFSPELFFSLYSRERGFRDTQVFMAELNRPSRWYRLRSPMDSGKRVNVINHEKTYLLVLTTKSAGARSAAQDAPQQSDYVQEWSNPSQPPARNAGPLRAQVKKAGRLTGLSSLATAIREPLRTLRHRLVGHRQRLRADRSDMEEIDLQSLL
jgi:hypothetical protein